MLASCSGVLLVVLRVGPNGRTVRKLSLLASHAMPISKHHHDPRHAKEKREAEQHAVITSGRLTPRNTSRGLSATEAVFRSKGRISCPRKRLPSIATKAKSAAVTLKGMHSRRTSSEKRLCRRADNTNKGRLPTVAMARYTGTGEEIASREGMKTFDGALHS
jgi:hypothetical protein